jgi:hypothetical protein
MPFMQRRQTQLNGIISMHEWWLHLPGTCLWYTVKTEACNTRCWFDKLSPVLIISLNKTHQSSVFTMYVSTLLLHPLPEFQPYNTCSLGDTTQTSKMLWNASRKLWNASRMLQKAMKCQQNATESYEMLQKAMKWNATESYEMPQNAMKCYRMLYIPDCYEMSKNVTEMLQNDTYEMPQNVTECYIP